jgi:hypothetical protein
MSAAQIQLAAARDVFLSGNPERTFFEGNYKKIDNKLSQTFEYPFDNPVTTFGQTGICTIPKKGDTVTGVTLKVVLPQIYTPISQAMYVYPIPSSRFDGALYVQVPIVSVTSDGSQITIVTLNPTTANTGALFSLINTVLFDGDYTITSKIDMYTFTADSNADPAVSTTGSVSFLDVRPRDVTGYFSTQNITLWSDDFTDVPISLVSLSGDGSVVTGVTNGSVGQDLVPGTIIVIDGVTGGTGIFNGTFTVLTYNSGTNTFTYNATGTGSPDVTNARMSSPAMSIQYDPVFNVFQFTSVLFTSIRFVSARDAAFWGFDFRQGPEFLFVNGKLTSQWTLVQGGWIYGFLPPGDSSYVDSVANKLIKSVRVMVGKQTINEFSGEYIELYNDLNTPYENQAIYKLLCGKYDTTQASQSRTYYVKIPLGFKSIPHLTYQNIEVQIDFDILTNLSTTINPGIGFFDPLSYTTFDATDNVIKLQGELINTIATLSFEEYIAFRTKAGSVVIYNSTKPIDDSNSYSVVSSYLYAIGESFFTDFTTLGQTLYAQAYNNFLLRGNIPDLVDGDISGFTGNDFLPTLPISTITNTYFAANGVGGFIQTATPHYIRTGDTITVKNATPSGFNGSYTANVISSTSFDFLTTNAGVASNPGVTITKGTFVLTNTLITQFGTGVQVTTLTPHYYSAGDQIQISGSTGYDGIITVLYVTSPTQYTFFSTTNLDPPVVIPGGLAGVSVKQIEYSNNPPNGLVTDGVYVYYAVMSTRPTTYFIRYDHSKSLFDNSNAYLSIDFTSNVTSSNYIYTILDTIFTGTSIYVLPKENTSNIIYIYNINGDFMDPESWQSFDYYTLLGIDFISTGICIGPYMYFIADGYKIVQYNVFQSYSDISSYTIIDTLAQNLIPWSIIGTNWNLVGTEMPLKNLMSTGKYMYMSAGGITSDVYLSGQACVIRVDVSKGLDDPNSYEYYSSAGDSPVEFDFSSNTYAVNAEDNPSVTLKTPITLNSPIPNLNLSIVGDGSKAVVTTQNTHSLYTGMVVLIQGSTSFDSITPYPVTGIIDDKTYTIATSIVATNNVPSAGVTLSILNLSITGPGGGAAYVTTLNPHGLSAGMVVLIQGSASFDSPVPYTVTTIINETNYVISTGITATDYAPSAGVTISTLNVSIVGAATGAECTTLNPHGLTDGMFVIIKGSTHFDTPEPIAIKYKNPYTYAFASAVGVVTDVAPNAGATINVLINKSIIGDGTSTQVTIQDLVLKNHLLSVGDIITIQNAEPAFLNGTQIVTQVPNTTQFKFASPYLAGRYTPKIFISGPRYVYMYTNDTGTYGNTQAKNIIRYDQYTQTPNLTASLLVDFEKHETPPPENQLIGVVQVAKSNSPLDMQFKGPIKEMWFTGTVDSTNVFQYSSIADQTSLELTHGEEIVTRDVGSYTFYNTVQPFNNHTVMPTRNFSMYSFEMDPESTTPNGTVNFSRINEQIFSNASATVWARSYNILKIQGGVGGLLFNS